MKEVSHLRVDIRKCFLNLWQGKNFITKNGNIKITFRFIGNYWFRVSKMTSWYYFIQRQKVWLCVTYKEWLWSVIDIGKIAIKKCFEYVSNKNAYILFEMCCYSLVCRCLISTIICFRKQNIKIHLHKLVRLFCLHIPSIAVIEMFVLSLSLRGHHSSFFPKAVLWSFIRRWFVKEMLHV